MAIVQCLRGGGFCVRGAYAKFLFRSFIRDNLVNIITRVDVWYPGNN